jgi:hypothetical protein
MDNMNCNDIAANAAKATNAAYASKATNAAYAANAAANPFNRTSANGISLTSGAYTTDTRSGDCADDGAYISSAGRTTRHAQPVTATRVANMSIPVSIKPMVSAGAVSFTAAAPMITTGKISPFAGNCSCGSCDFVLSQQIRMDLPVAFAVDVAVGEPSIGCQDEDCSCDKAL